MSADRPFRFGVKFRRAGTGAALAERARRIESMGYSTLLFSDHFWDVLGPLTGAMAAAAATTTLRVGTNVLGNDFRHPVVLAKDVATVDRLSDGRFELGLGAGWMADDYDRAGMHMDRPGVRIERMEEALRVMKGSGARALSTMRARTTRSDDSRGIPNPSSPAGHRS